MKNFFNFDLTTATIYVNILWQNPIALLAQLDRVSGYGPEGQGFESLTARHKKTRLYESTTLFFFYDCIIKYETARDSNKEALKTVRWTVLPTRQRAK